MYGKILFFFFRLTNGPMEIYIYTYIHATFFIHSSTNEYLACFSILAIVGNTEMNMGVWIFFSDPHFNHFMYVLEVGLLGYMVVLLLNF